jgi:predicted tellurium resistance membrane protein TerC
MIELLSDPQTYISLLSLTLLEIVLGIDNVIFISILAGKLPEQDRAKVRQLGLLIAVLGRLVLLAAISWITQLTQPIIELGEYTLSGKDLVMLVGGLFLVYKSTQEIYDKVEGTGHHLHQTAGAATFGAILFQIILMDMVFSLDSIITAIGLVKHVSIMVVSILISLGIMMWSANGIGGFIDKHPSVKVLALSFLLMIGTMLMAEGFHYHIPKEYIYSSLAFAMLVEFINIRANTRKSSSGETRS